MSEKVLNVQKLSKQYVTGNGIKTVALRDVNLSVKKNEMVAVMGKSGSGKSTLINALTGILPVDDGQILLNDTDILKIPKKERALFRRRNIGIIFQNYMLIDSLTIGENIKVPLILDENYDRQDEKVIELASLLGIANILEKYPYEISGGQQQRAGICRALMNTPNIIFADEPTGNLDALSTEQVMSYFTQICKQRKSSLLIVTHDAKVSSFCDRVIFLSDGKAVAELSKQNKREKEFYESILDCQKEVLI